MNSKTAWWLVVVGLFWLTACHKPRTKSRDRSAQTDTTQAAFIDSLLATGGTVIEEVDFDYLTAKSKFSFKSRSQNTDNTNINIRIQKDSVIWLSVTGVGLEIARGIITPDSIAFMDKFHKEYYVFSYEQLSRQFNFRLSFPLIQSLIVGNLLFPHSPNETIRREQDFLVLQQNQGRLSIDNYISESNRKITRLRAVEQPSNNTLQLEYEDFTPLNNYLFPYTSLITLDMPSGKDQSPAQTIIHIKHSKVELNETPLSFPFSVPASYKRKP